MSFFLFNLVGVLERVLAELLRLGSFGFEEGSL